VLLGCSASGDGRDRSRGSGGAAGAGGVGGFGRDSGLPGFDGASGCQTTLSGIVYDPAGKLPLFNVVVYVPSEALEPIGQGAGCQTCDGHFSGRPIAAALSDSAGKFRLNLERVPQRENIPLVVQVGKWRRELVIPRATECVDTPVAEGSVGGARRLGRARMSVPKDRHRGFGILDG
jgi:hypothetical protein